jgi:hypothetical protein
MAKNHENKNFPHQYPTGLEIITFQALIAGIRFNFQSSSTSSTLPSKFGNEENLEIRRK